MSNLTGGFELDWGQDSHIKKYQVFEIDEDLLALSCTWQRIRKSRIDNPASPYQPIQQLTDKNLFKIVHQCDHDKASNIRDYYSKKIMMWRLKEQKLSKFRDDMNTFIHSDGKVFREDMQPLAYRLPEFYDYDTAFDSLTNEYNKKVSQDNRIDNSTKQLKLVKTFTVGKKYSKRKEYWFSDEHNNLVNMSFVHDNPLLPLLETFSTKPFSMTANYVKKYRDNNEYLEANKFKFV